MMMTMRATMLLALFAQGACVSRDVARFLRREQRDDGFLVRKRAAPKFHEDLLQRSEAISATFQALSHLSSLSPTTRRFLASLRVCGACDNFKRFGEPDDGGYLVCMDGWDGGVVAGYSMGVEHHDKWSKDLAEVLRGEGKTGTVLHQFDCTVDDGQECPGCAFHKICIAAENDAPKENFMSMSQVLKETNLDAAADRSLLMKMDIEAAEWPILATERPEVLKKFRQVILELHWLDKEQYHEQYAAAMDAMQGAGFTVVHIHGNNFASMYTPQGSQYSVPNVVEVTFMADAKKTECMGEQQLNSLDHDNNPNKAPLEMAKLPTLTPNF